MRKVLKRTVALICATTLFLPTNLPGIEAADANSVAITMDNVLTLGRTFEKDGVVTFSYANSGVEIHFVGTGLSAEIVAGQDEGTKQNIAVFIDDKIQPEEAKVIAVTKSDEYSIVKDLPYGEHTVTIRKMNRGYYGFLAAQTIGIKNINIDGNGELLPKNEDKELTIEVYGDSITNGDALYLESDNSNSAFSWAGYVGEVARYFDADLQSCGISGNGLLRSVLKDENGIYFNLFTPQNNWGKLDESATQQAYSHSENPADVVIINLGTNDNAAFTAGQISAQDFKAEYKRFMNEIHQDCPDAIIVGALGAMGAEGLFGAIEEAVNESNSSWGKNYAYFTELPNCAGIRDGKGYDNSHPSRVAHKVYGQQINTIIEKALIENGKIDENEFKKVNVVKATGTSTDEPSSRTADKAVDGNVSTRWASSNYDGNNEWITLELDGVYEINKVNLLWETAYAREYNVQTSLDGINWVTDSTFNYGNGYTETKKLNGNRAKYVRFNMISRGTFYSYSLYEIELFGKKVAEETVDVEKGKNIVGEMFMPLSISPNDARTLIDNSGMSGLEAPNHLCASFDSNDTTSAEKISQNMYSSTNKTDIIVDLGKKECLGEMFIWNYNDLRHLENCVKEVKVSYSENGNDYQMLGTYVLSKNSVSDNEAYGGNVACDISCITSLDGDISSKSSIDFGGVTGRYIKITPVSNYGGTEYGLSEIRVFRHKTEPIEDESITIDGFVPNQMDNVSYINMFNNSGFSKIDSHVEDDEKVSNDVKDMAILTGGTDKSTIIMNLDGNYPLKNIKIWNYNEPGNMDIGLKEFDLYYTVDAPCQIITHTNEAIAAGEKDYIDWNRGNWKKLGSYIIPKGTGMKDMAASLTIDVEGIRAQHIKLVPNKNHRGNSDSFGLSEIKVYVDNGWATEYSREWSGMLSSSGEFAYQGNNVADSKGSSLNTNNNGRGWIGGDGIHITSLNGSQLQGSVNSNSKNIFTFQDSFEGNFGNYDGFGLTQGFAQKDNSGFSIGMRNMAYMYLEGDEPDVRNIKMYMTTEPGTYDNHSYDGFNIYPGSYWLGDSTVVNNKLYTVANMFSGLTITGADFYESPISASGFPSMNAIPNLLYSQIDNSKGIPYHETIYEEGEYLYVYGKKDNKLVCSRVLAQDYPSLSGFQYWTGNGWSSNANDVAYISDFMPGNEFNITKIQSGTFAGKYMLVHTAMSISGAVCYALADKPTGPFVQPADGQMYWSTEKYKLHMRYYKDSSVIYQQWNYNAKSQPSISKDGELLVTYHFGIHDDQANRVPAYGWFQAVGKEYEHPTFVKMFDIAKRNMILDEAGKVNLALNGTVTASTIENAGLEAEYAIDGNSETRWASTYDDMNYITIDLNENKNICKVVLNWEAAYGRDYDILVSTDGNEWKKVAGTKEGDGGIDEYHFETVSARYVRMAGNARGTIYGYSLFEFEVYSPKKDEVPMVEINGWQISTENRGFRIVYSYSDSHDVVAERGLIYGLGGRVRDDEMYVGSTNKYVYSYQGTDKGKRAVTESKLPDSSTYVMTMKYIKSADYLKTDMMVRPYLRLKDGTYIYGNVESYSVFNLAEYIYKNGLMSNETLHNFIYDDIIKIVDSNYQKILY